MSTDAPANSDGRNIPDSAAEAWAEVYIDVAEKLDAEQQDAVSGPKQCDVKSPLQKGEAECPTT